MFPSNLRTKFMMTVAVLAASLCTSTAGLAQSPKGANPQKGSDGAGAKDDAFAPMVKTDDEDYAKVRSQFRTKLTRKGPSPQEWTAVKPPKGVSEIEYESGDL